MAAGVQEVWLSQLSGRILAGGQGRSHHKIDPLFLPDRYLRVPPDGRDLWVFPEDLPSLGLRATHSSAEQGDGTP